MKKYDTLVFIGRFQPFHKGHEHIIDKAVELAENVVIIIGSTNLARSIRNPFSFEERKEQIKMVYPDKKVIIKPVGDYPYDGNKWIYEVQDAVMEATPEATNIGLIGHEKDNSSYYLKIFPKWGNEAVSNLDGIDATDIRNSIFLNNDMTLAERLMPMSAYWAMDRQINPKYKWVNIIREEAQMISKYKKAWENAPYSPTFVTVDAVVVQSGHVLLVRRGAMPGKGHWALPGGFLNQDERLIDGALRELREETKLKVPLAVLKGSVKDKEIFDSPYRSQRGRTITQAFYIDLGFDNKLPKTKASDDADKVQWVAFNQINPKEMFEDHFFILDYFLNIS